MTKIVCGFPGIGKTYLSKNCPELVVIDNDYMSYIDAERQHLFISDCKRMVDDGVDFILTSTCDECLDTLIKEGFDITVVVPDKKLKYEYINRYRRRGNCWGFVEKVYSSWDSTIDKLMNDDRFKVVILKSGETLSDVYKDL